MQKSYVDKSAFLTGQPQPHPKPESAPYSLLYMKKILLAQAPYRCLYSQSPPHWRGGDPSRSIADTIEAEHLSSMDRRRCLSTNMELDEGSVGL